MDCRCPGILILWPNEFSFFLSWSVKTQLNFFEEFWVVENQVKSRALGSKRHPHSFFLSQLLWHRSPSIFFCFLGGEYSTSVSLTLPHSGLRVFTSYILQETARQSVCAPGAGFNSLQFCRLVAYRWRVVSLVPNNSPVRGSPFGLPSPSLFCFWIHTASAPSTAGTHTDGGAVIR